MSGGRLTNNDYQFINRDLTMIISAVSSKYDIPITDLENLKNSLDTHLHSPHMEYGKSNKM